MIELACGAALGLACFIGGVWWERQDRRSLLNRTVDELIIANANDCSEETRLS